MPLTYALHQNFVRLTRACRQSLFSGIVTLVCLLLSISAAAAPVPCVKPDLDEAEQARASAEKAVKTLLRFLRASDQDTTDLLIKWFGDSGQKTRQTVTDVYAKSLTWIGSLTFYCHYNNEGEFVEVEIDGSTGQPIEVDYADAVFAYVYPTEISKVYLGIAFYSAPKSGYDSKLGTLVHEVTHFWLTGSTDDLAYGRQDSLNLAKIDPKAALSNADSYQYFIEDWLQ